MSNYVYKPINFIVQNVQPGQVVRVSLNQSGTRVGFSAGEPLNRFGGMEISARNGALPL